jgi:hypothetical protein
MGAGPEWHTIGGGAVVEFASTPFTTSVVGSGAVSGGSNFVLSTEQGIISNVMGASRISGTFKFFLLNSILFPHLLPFPGRDQSIGSVFTSFRSFSLPQPLLGKTFAAAVVGMDVDGSTNPVFPGFTVLNNGNLEPNLVYGFGRPVGGAIAGDFYFNVQPSHFWNNNTLSIYGFINEALGDGEFFLFEGQIATVNGFTVQPTWELTRLFEAEMAALSGYTLQSNYYIERVVGVSPIQTVSQLLEKPNGGGIGILDFDVVHGRTVKNPFAINQLNSCGEACNLPPPCNFLLPKQCKADQVCRLIYVNGRPFGVNDQIAPECSTQ